MRTNIGQENFFPRKRRVILLLLLTLNKKEKKSSSNYFLAKVRRNGFLLKGEEKILFSSDNKANFFCVKGKTLIKK